MSSKKQPEERVNPLFANTSKRIEPVQPKGIVENSQPVSSAAGEPPATPQPHDLPSAGVRHRRVGTVPFKEAYKQFTSFLDIELDRRFHALLAEKGVTKTELFNEAILDLLNKYSK